MKTGFACPTCLAPLVLTCTVTAMDDLAAAAPPLPCPNPFCRTELPSRRGDLSLTYALFGTIVTDTTARLHGLP